MENTSSQVDLAKLHDLISNPTIMEMLSHFQKQKADEKAETERIQAERIEAEKEAERVEAEKEAERVEAEKEAERVKAEKEAERVEAEREAEKAKRKKRRITTQTAEELRKRAKPNAVPYKTPPTKEIPHL